MTGQPAPPSKPTWPLFLLAGLSFIPGFGFFLGSAAAVWGLVSSRRRALLGAVIGAAGALLNLVGMVAIGFGSFRSGPGFDQVRLRMTRENLVEVVASLEAYRNQRGAYPPSLVALQQQFRVGRPINIFDPSAGLFIGLRPFQYRLAPDGQSYDLFAVGADGKPGTDDDIRPVLPDSMRGKVGLRARD